MNGNTYGRFFRMTTCGESYSGAFNRDMNMPKQLKGGLMVIVDGVPPGILLEDAFVQMEMDKRRPGKSEIDTPRQERDKVYIYSGVMENNLTTGAPVGMMIPNSDMLEEQIEKHRQKRSTLRPGQATYTYYAKYGENFDWLGAGRSSGRETAARVAAGAVAKAILDGLGIDVIAYTKQIHTISTDFISYEKAKENYRKNDINCPDLEKGKEMVERILEVKEQGDSLGGIIEIIAKGVPEGLGEPVFDKLEAMLGSGLLSIGAVKGVEFGVGFGHVLLKGSESNDIPYMEEKTGKVSFRTNNAGGILGGISNGQEIRIRVAVKPTPTISIPQKTVNVKEKKDVEAIFSTRNDTTICARIFAVCEAMVRMTLVDAIYMAYGSKKLQELLSQK